MEDANAKAVKECFHITSSNEDVGYFMYGMLSQYPNHIISYHLEQLQQSVFLWVSIPKALWEVQQENIIGLAEYYHLTYQD